MEDESGSRDMEAVKFPWYENVANPETVITRTR